MEEILRRRHITILLLTPKNSCEKPQISWGLREGPVSLELGLEGETTLVEPKGTGKKVGRGTGLIDQKRPGGNELSSFSRRKAQNGGLGLQDKQGKGKGSLDPKGSFLAKRYERPKTKERWEKT